jgi:hypothetical protein
MTAKANKFDAALTKLGATIVSAHETINATRAKVAEQFKAAINLAVDAGKAGKMEMGDIRDAIVGVFEKHVADGHIEKATARAYLTGLRFALDRGVMWSTDLHSTEGQVRALTDANKTVPKALAEKAEMAAAKAAAKGAKQPVGDTVDTAMAKTIKLLAIWRTLGKNDVAACILDAIHMVNPGFTEPKAE